MFYLKRYYMNKIGICFVVLTILIILVNCFQSPVIEGFGSNKCYSNSDTIPTVITAENWSKYFTVDTGIANCNSNSNLGGKGTGCPTDVESYIKGPGIITWANGQSPTFRTKNPILSSGNGFVGFKLNSVPGFDGKGNAIDANIWNSI